MKALVTTLIVGLALSLGGPAEAQESLIDYCGRKIDNNETKSLKWCVDDLLKAAEREKGDGLAQHLYYAGLGLHHLGDNRTAVGVLDKALAVSGISSDTRRKVENARKKALYGSLTYKKKGEDKTPPAPRPTPKADPPPRQPAQPKTRVVEPLQPVPQPVKKAAERWPEISEPSATGGGDKDAALIVGIEDYAFVADVPGAKKNANDWFLHLTKGRKVPLSRVKLLRNNEATREQILEAAARAASKVKPGGTLWFVFIGHGAPSKSQKDGVLVGYDAQQSVTGLYARSLPQRELLDVLDKGKQARTVAVIDACFSGQTAAGSLAPGLQPLLPVTMKVPKQTVVLTAGKGTEFAGPLHNVARPAFSYLLLGAMRGWGDSDKDGKVTISEALTYTRQALDATLSGRQQTPELIGEASLGGSWLLATGARETGPDLARIVLGE